MKSAATTISDRFDVADIRRIREKDSERHLNMTAEEIIAEVNGNAEKIIALYDLKPLNCVGR